MKRGIGGASSLRDAALMLALGAPAFAGSPALGLTAADIAAKAADVSAADGAAINDYQCRFTSVRDDGDGNEEQRHAGIYYFKAPDRHGQEITELYVKGKKKDPKQAEGESESFDLKTPFDKDGVGDYNFTFVKTDVVDGVECYVLKFATEKRGEGYVYGRGWIETASFKVRAMDVAFYKNPKYVKDMDVKIWCADWGGHRMLQKFVATGEFSAYLVIRGSFTVTETYDDYQFNVGVPDAKVP